MSEQLAVPITALVPGSLYRALETQARRSHRRVGDLLVEHAAQNLSIEVVVEPHKRTWVRMTEKHLAEAAELWLDGASQGEIAKRLGISRSTIRNHWHRVIRTAEERAA